MPQGLPKKIEVALLFPDLALQFGDPSPRRSSLIEKRTAQRRAIQTALARTARPTQRLKPALPNLLLPFVQPLAVELQICRHSRYRLTSRYTLHGSSLGLRRDYLRSLHQFLSS
jgi:hypothetical protein